MGCMLLHWLCCFFFMNITNYGFNLVAVRDLAKKATNNQKTIGVIFNEVFSVKLYLTGLLLIVMLLLILFVPKFSSFKLIYLFASFLLISDLFSLRWFFLGMEKMKFLPAINLVATLIYVLLVVLFIRQPKDFVYIILFEAIGMLIAGFISFTYVLNEYQLTIKILPFKKVRKYMVANFSSFINLLVPSVLSNIAVLLVGFFSISTHVSFMQLGVKFSNAFSTVNAILTKVFYPMVNRNTSAMKLAFKVLISVGFILAVAMYFSADFLIKPWLKLENAYALEQVVFIIKLLSPTSLLMAIISSYSVNGLLVFGKDKVVGVITVFATLTGLIIGVFLIIKYTYLGGAVFLIAARGLYALLSYVLFKKNNAETGLIQK